MPTPFDTAHIPRSYDPGRGIQLAQSSDDVSVSSQLTYLRTCLSLSGATYRLSTEWTRALIGQLEDCEDRGRKTITVESYKEMRSLAKEVQNLKIKLHHMNKQSAEQTARMDELAKREHELTLAKLGYQPRK